MVSEFIMLINEIVKVWVWFGKILVSIVYIIGLRDIVNEVINVIMLNNIKGVFILILLVSNGCWYVLYLLLVSVVFSVCLNLMFE